MGRPVDALRASASALRACEDRLIVEKSDPYAGVRQLYADQERAVRAFGSPLYGVAGLSGVVSAHRLSVDGRCDTVHLRFPAPALVEVITATRPQGGTQHILGEVAAAAVRRCPSLPFSISVGERVAYVEVDGIRTQFRVMETDDQSTWVAVGGLRKRHIRLNGGGGRTIDEITLIPVAFELADR